MKLPVWAVLALSAAGCSLIIPLDYTGGVGGSSGSGGAGSSYGGTAGMGNAPQGGTSQGAEAGTGDEGGNPPGGAGPEGGTGGNNQGGTQSGGRGGTTGGTDGGTAGKGGTSGGVGGSSMGGEEAGGEPGTGGGGGTSGGGMGGTSGTSGASGGRSGRGGTGGVSGMSGMGGTAGCNADLTSDPMHCGSCTTKCQNNDPCIDSKCVSSPCDELGCTKVVQADYSQNQGPRADSVGTADVCVEVPTYMPNSSFSPAFNCWNASGRTVQVNEVTFMCDQGDKGMQMPRRKGGYCVHFSMGETAQAGFIMPNNPSCCSNGTGTCCAPTGGTGGT